MILENIQISEEETIISFVFPVFNEEIRIYNLPSIVDYFRGVFPIKFEILIVCNGCTDSTFSIAKVMTQSIPELRVIETSARGRGHALRIGFQECLGYYAAVCAIDRAWDESFYIQAFELIIDSQLDIVYGQKTHPRSRVSRPFSRRLISCFAILYNYIMFGSLAGDMNCIKLFKKSSCDFLDSLGNYNYFAEAEFFLRASRSHCRCGFLPVNVVDSNLGSKVKLTSILAYLFDSVHFRFILKE
jgi:glycosyltransferase involved in cell wall biosynthesis